MKKSFVLLLSTVALAACGSDPAGSAVGPDVEQFEPDVEVSCSSDSDCEDEVACTAGACVDGVCDFTLDDARCDDGRFCNGQEVCTLLGCVAADMGACDDNAMCTDDLCDEVSDTCEHVPNDGLCGDGDACNGAETCSADGTCTGGTALDCDDGVACTIDDCDALGGCSHTPDHASCDDGNPCTIDTCLGAGGCLHQPDDSLCAAGEICRLDEGCFAPSACTTELDPRCDDGVDCTIDRCDAATGRCIYERLDAECDNGLFCDGAEICTPFVGCITQDVPQCDDGVACTIDQCDDDIDACQNLAEARLCDDGDFCNGAEICDPAAGGCVDTPAPDCTDTDECTDDICDPVLNRCTNDIRDADGDGYGDEACGGLDCNEDNPMINSGMPEICDGLDQNCNGFIDEGVLSQCGDCNQSCRLEETVVETIDEELETETTGLEFDPTVGGVVLSRSTVTSNFLWVPNTEESTLSRWDADTTTEMGRYYVGLPEGECAGSCCWANGCNQPSRVVIDGNGDAYVANRGFAMQGTVTKIAASIDDCVDRNGNGVIDTSVDNVPLAWGEDECVLWTAPVDDANAVLRALAIDRGDAEHPEGYPWVGGYNTMRWHRLHPDTGEIMTTIPVSVHPYGGVVVGDGKLWIGTLSDGATQWIDTVTGEVGPVIGYPTSRRTVNGTSSYGITADARGRIWIAGWAGRDALGYDPRSANWTVVDTTAEGVNAGRGITVDGEGRIWMALGGDGQSRLAVWDSDGFVPGGTIYPHAIEIIDTPAGNLAPSGVGADRNGDVWLAHHALPTGDALLESGHSNLIRLDPETFAYDVFPGPGRVYTYSDFTGAVRRTVIGRGLINRVYESGCEINEAWETLTWDATVPAGAQITFTVRTADTREDLDAASWITVAIAPDDASPARIDDALAAALREPLAFLELTVTLEANADGESPILRDYSVQWLCDQPISD